MNRTDDKESHPAPERSAELTAANQVAPVSPDRAINALRAAMQLIPFGIGSAIETYYFGGMEQRKLDRMERWIEDLARDLRELKDACVDIPESRFQSEEFDYFMDGALRGAANEVSAAKLEALRGVLVSVIIDRPKLSFDKRASFLRTVLDLEGVHVRLLQAMAARRAEGESRRFVLVPALCRVVDAHGEADADFVYSALDTLANREFIASGPVPFDEAGRIEKKRQEFAITALGIEFIEFVRLEGVDVARH